MDLTFENHGRRQSPSANNDVLYRTSLMDIDRSGEVKMETLETVYIVQTLKGWCTIEDAYQELDQLAASPYASERRGVAMRLLRYKRQGLLIRRKVGTRLIEYKLSQKGEDRLIYFWKKFHLLEPPPDWQSMGEHGKIEKELADNQARVHARILADQLERLKKNKPLKTPKTKRVKIKFESTLREIEERKNRMRIYPRKEAR